VWNLTNIKVLHLSGKYMYHKISLKKVKLSRYRPGVAQSVGRGTALHDRGTRRRWVVSSTPRPHFTRRKDPVPILQETGWAPGPVWTGRKSCPHRDSIPDRPARSQSLYRLSYPAHIKCPYWFVICCWITNRHEAHRNDLLCQAIVRENWHYFHSSIKFVMIRCVSTHGIRSIYAYTSH
jgi:hypothetical protein